MILPPTLLSKYLNRFDELLKAGQAIYDSVEVEPKGAPGLFGAPASDKYIIDEQAFLKWQVNCISLLDQVIPAHSIQRKLIEELRNVRDSKRNLEKYLSVLKALKEDFEKGFLEDLALQIEAEIAADYMGQAEQLLAEGQSGKYDHVPAAVLTGAVLEKSLRTLCTQQTPPLPLENGKGEPLMMNRLIDDLKKAGVFSELKAKQLRAWAEIRNKAAHGEFNQFNRSDVETMIAGVSNFLSDYL